MSKALPVSPLASALPVLPALKGVRLGAVAANIRYQDRLDLMMMVFDEGTTVAGVLTQNRCPGAPVDWCRSCLKHGKARALVVNSGNANVFTGQAGHIATQETANEASRLIGCDPTEVFLASTGVIGETLPTQKLLSAMPDLYSQITEDGWKDAAHAIMTTDTFAKAVTQQVLIGDTLVTIQGIAKGSGMIAPDLATMLSFIVTDAKISHEALQNLLSEAVQSSFNCITVDSDTSTSDAVLLFGTGAAGNDEVRDISEPGFAAFRSVFTEVMQNLALMVIKDGEGIQKLIQVDVSGASDPDSARRIGLSIANSPLVKTAVAGADANWGRVAMAIGKSGEPADRDTLSIGIGGIWIARNGEPVEGYDEGPVQAHMRGDTVTIQVDLALGDGAGRVWGCDLTHGYININGDYRS